MPCPSKRIKSGDPFEQLDLDSFGNRFLVARVQPVEPSPFDARRVPRQPQRGRRQIRDVTPLAPERAQLDLVRVGQGIEHQCRSRVWRDESHLLARRYARIGRPESLRSQRGRDPALPARGGRLAHFRQRSGSSLRHARPEEMRQLLPGGASSAAAADGACGAAAAAGGSLLSRVRTDVHVGPACARPPLAPDADARRPGRLAATGPDASVQQLVVAVVAASATVVPAAAVVATAVVVIAVVVVAVLAAATLRLLSLGADLVVVALVPAGATVAPVIVGVATRPAIRDASVALAMIPVAAAHVPAPLADLIVAAAIAASAAVVAVVVRVAAGIAIRHAAVPVAVGASGAADPVPVLADSLTCS